jgi:dTDP-L-rhamnose 4-epimerase
LNNILITGGAGFIGSKLALGLIEKNFNVRILDNLSPQIHGETPELTSPTYQSIKDKADVQIGTVTSKSDWQKSIEDQDAIIHLAAETGTGQSMYEIGKYCDVNISGTAKMLDILTNEKHRVKKIIVASSRAIYGEGKYHCAQHGNVYPEARSEEDMLTNDYNCKCPVCNQSVQLVSTTEDSKIHPTSIYGITKQNQEQMVLNVCEALNIPAVSFRYQNVYGPGQSLNNPYTGILSIFSNLLINGSSINIFEDGKESRDFVYIEDVVRATITGLENNSANFEVFNIGSSKATDVLTVANLLKDLYESDSDITVTGSFRLGDIRHNYADVNKAKELLSYEPSYDFKKGITRFAQWVKSTPIEKNDNYEKSLSEMKEKGLFKTPEK